MILKQKYFKLSGSWRTNRTGNNGKKSCYTTLLTKITLMFTKIKERKNN